MRECEKATQKGKVHRNAWELFKSFDPDVSFYFTTSNGSISHDGRQQHREQLMVGLVF